MAVPDFSKIWASQSPLTPYEFSDEDYLDGWEFVGEIPPYRFMFDAWQRQADTKMQWLYLNAANLLRKNSTQYAVGDIAFSAALPSNLVLVCTTVGTTAATEPDFSGAVIGGTVTDGTAVWTYMPLGTLSREITPAFNHRDVIVTSGNYTAPVTGWYRITVKGGGGGGAGGRNSSISYGGGGGGGEGGTTIAYKFMTMGAVASVVIGAGGTGGAVSANGSKGGDSTVTIGAETYTGGGGGGGMFAYGGGEGGAGGSGTIGGCAGYRGGSVNVNSGGTDGGSGGGAGGATGSNSAITGGGGRGGNAGTTAEAMTAGKAGGNGFAWFEFFAEV